jgi:hypothetical protein
MSVFSPDDTREVIEKALPEDTSYHGEAPEPRYLYVPLRHLQALSPDHGLVVGIRGAGKSVWWAALQSEAHRQIVAAALPSLALQEVSTTSAGFGEENRPDEYPDKKTIELLLKNGIKPVDLWRTVIAWNTWGRDGEVEGSTWLERARWIRSHPEEAALKFRFYDDQMARRERKHLVLFDALDRAADEWSQLRMLLRGLLEVLLEFRSYRAVRAKAFVRLDMLNDPEVVGFRDASKVLASKVELVWSRADLYGLLFQHLGNGPMKGETFRKGCTQIGSGSWSEFQGIWRVPKALRDDEDLQRKVFDEIAGEWMGRDRRRGFPYTWLPNHLADATGQVSPRSFLAAIKAAAENSNQSKEHALHYEGIKKGVQRASKIRVDEVGDDFPWVRLLMDPLNGLVIPCKFEEIRIRWENTGVRERLERPIGDGDALPPKHLSEGLAGLRRDLLELALFSEQRDGRINMPDVYRVGFGLGRMGGVKPIR